MPIAALDAADWAGYIAAENAGPSTTVRREVTDALEPEDRVLANRYFAGSPMHGGRFVQDWNRTSCCCPRARRAARWSSCTG